MAEGWIRWANRAIWAAWAILGAVHLATLDSVPAGLHLDEAYNALDALRIGVDGFWPVFLSSNFGREALMHYFVALSLRIFGLQVWAVRLPAYLAWLASLPALWWLLREMFPDLRERIGHWLIAAPLFLTCLWFAVTAHYAIRISVFVLVEMLFIAALWRAWRTRRSGPALLSGALGGLCAYTYIASRMLPLLLLLTLCLALVTRPREVIARRRLLTTIMLTIIIVALPLIVHFIRVPTDFYWRASQVAISSGGEGTGDSIVKVFVDSTVRTAGMFFRNGAENPRNNIPGRPVFTWAMLPPFLLGLGLALRWRQKPRETFILLWLLVMLIPTWLSQEAPAFHRAIGAFPPAMLLAANGGYEWWRLAQQYGNRIPKASRLVSGLLGIAVLWETGAGLHAFWEWSSQPALYFAFDAGLREVGTWVANLSSEERVYFSPLSNPISMGFYLSMKPTAPVLRHFDGRHALVLRPGETMRYVVMVQEDDHLEQKLSALLLGQLPQPERQFYDIEGKPFARIYHIAGESRLRGPQFPQEAVWLDGIRLIGYDLDQCCLYDKGDTMLLRLWWQLAGETPKDKWTVFTHLLNSSGVWVAGHDSEPGRGSYPTTVWEPGDTIIDDHPIRIPPEAISGDYRLEIGLYNWQTGRRLPLTVSGKDHAILGSVTIK